MEFRRFETKILWSTVSKWPKKALLVAILSDFGEDVEGRMRVWDGINVWKMIQKLLTSHWLMQEKLFVDDGIG